MVKTLWASNAGDTGYIPGWGTESHMPCSVTGGKDETFLIPTCDIQIDASWPWCVWASGPGVYAAGLQPRGQMGASMPPAAPAYPQPCYIGC